MFAESAYVEFAVESSYGSISATTGLPDVSGLPFVADEVELDSVSFDGLEPISRTVTAARGTPAPQPDEVHGPSGVDLYQGSITLRGSVRGPGDGALRTTGQNMLQWRLLGTALVRMTPTIASESLSSNADSTSVLNVADATVYQHGRMIGFEAGGKVQICHVVGIDLDNNKITISPAASTALQSGQVIRLMDTWYLPRKGELGVPTGPSLAIRLRTRDSYGWLCTGMRATAFRWTADESGFVTWEAEVDVAWGQRGTGGNFDATAVNTGRLVNASQRIAEQRGVLSVLDSGVTDVYPTSAPTVADRLELSDEMWALEIVLSVSPRPQQNYMGRSELRVGGWREGTQVTLSNVVDTTGVLRAMYRERHQRSLVVGAGPFAVGSGVGVVVPGALMANEVFEDMSGDELQYSALAFRPGAHASHESPGSGTENAALYLGSVFPTSLN